MPFFRNRQHLTRRDAAQFIIRDIIEQRTQQHVRHRFRDRHHVQQTLIGDHIGERGPALEGAEHRAFGGIVDRILFDFGTVRRVPRVVSINIAIKHVGKHFLIGRQQPALQGAGVGMRAQTFRGGSRRAAANAVRVDDAHVRVKPLFPVAVKRPQAVKK